jgi:type VI secretion system secreted protein VgrG
MSTPTSAALVAGQGVQFSAEDNISAVAGKNADWSVLKRFTVAAGEKISLFVQKLGIKIFAAKGPVEVQAQSGPMSLIADKDVNVASVNGSVHIVAKKELILECGGAFIQLKDGSITLGGPFDLFIKTITVQKKGKASFAESVNSWGHAKFDEHFALTWPFDGTPIANRKFSITRADGTVIHGITDAEGKTGLQRSLLVEGMQLRIHRD